MISLDDETTMLHHLAKAIVLTLLALAVIVKTVAYWGLAQTDAE